MAHFYQLKEFGQSSAIDGTLMVAGACGKELAFTVSLDGARGLKTSIWRVIKESMSLVNTVSGYGRVLHAWVREESTLAYLLHQREMTLDLIKCETGQVIDRTEFPFKPKACLRFPPGGDLFIGSQPSHLALVNQTREGMRVTKAQGLFQLLQEYDSIHQTVPLSDQFRFVLLVSKQGTFHLVVVHANPVKDGVTFKVIDSYKFKRTQNVDFVSVQESSG